MSYALPRVPLKWVDPLNIVLIILTCGLAHLLPYHLLIFSYAVLGPAHYLTQISWLHDKRYFTQSPQLTAAPMIIAAALMVIIFLMHDDTHAVMTNALIWDIALAISFVLVMPPRLIPRLLAAFGAGAVILIGLHSPAAILFAALLLPTIVHVFVFTAAFMLMGAMRSHKISAYLSFFALLIGALTFFVPMASDAPPSLAGISFFQAVVDFLHKFPGLSNAQEKQLFGFLSFAYTYHYLNWFSKAEVIHWDRIPARRMGAIIVMYVMALAIYAYNYEYGFIVLLFLSYLHVLLEFPLNMRTFAGIAKGMV